MDERRASCMGYAPNAQQPCVSPVCTQLGRRVSHIARPTKTFETAGDAAVLLWCCEDALTSFNHPTWNLYKSPFLSPSFQPELELLSVDTSRSLYQIPLRELSVTERSASTRCLPGSDCRAFAPEEEIGRNSVRTVDRPAQPRKATRLRYVPVLSLEMELAFSVLSSSRRAGSY
jgi:hypothetical protein